MYIGITILFILSILFISTIIYAEDGIIAYFDGDVTVQREGFTIEAEFGLFVFQGDRGKVTFNSGSKLTEPVFIFTYGQQEKTVLQLMIVIMLKKTV